jgi:hypothetical protein
MLVRSAAAQTPSPAATAQIVPQPSAPYISSQPCPPVLDVADVLTQYASLTRLEIIRNYLLVQGKVSIDDVSGLAPQKAISIIEHSLFSCGFAITQNDPGKVEVSGLSAAIRTIGTPLLSDRTALPTHERVVSFIFRFMYRDAKEMQQIFGQYLSPPQSYTSLLAEPNGKTLVVTERTSVIRGLFDMVAQMDVPDWKSEP